MEGVLRWLLLLLRMLDLRRWRERGIVRGSIGLDCVQRKAVAKGVEKLGVTHTPWSMFWIRAGVHRSRDFARSGGRTRSGEAVTLSNDDCEDKEK